MKVKTLINHREYRKGECIYNEGDKLDSIVIINEGSAKALKYTSDGREQILYVFSEGDFFGEQYLLSDQIATFTVEALEKVKVCMFTKENFTQLILNYPNIAMQIIEELGGRVTQLLNTIQNMGVLYYWIFLKNTVKRSRKELSFVCLLAVKEWLII